MRFDARYLCVEQGDPRGQFILRVWPKVFACEAMSGVKGGVPQGTRARVVIHCDAALCARSLLSILWMAIRRLMFITRQPCGQVLQSGNIGRARRPDTGSELWASFKGAR